MDSKTKLYIGIGVGVVLLVIIAIVITVSMGGDPTVPGVATAAAAAAAGAAAASRGKAQEKVAEAKVAGDALAEAQRIDAESALVAMNAASTTVAGETHDQKAADGDKAFGG